MVWNLHTEVSDGTVQSASNSSRAPAFVPDLVLLQAMTMMCLASLRPIHVMPLSQVGLVPHNSQHLSQAAVTTLHDNLGWGSWPSRGCCSHLPGECGDRRDLSILRGGEPGGGRDGAGVQGQRIPPAPKELQSLLRRNNRALVRTPSALLGESCASKHAPVLLTLHLSPTMPSIMHPAVQQPCLHRWQMPCMLSPCKVDEKPGVCR